VVRPQSFSGHNKIREGTKKLGEALQPNAPPLVATGLDDIVQSGRSRYSS